MKITIAGYYKLEEVPFVAKTKISGQYRVSYVYPLHFFQEEEKVVKK